MTAKQRLLVVDDERDVVTGFRRVFEREGLVLDAAYSGQEALASVRANRPDVVVLDLRMPGLDGLQTLKHIQAEDPRTLVILMTAYSSSATVIEAMKHGAYDYLVKPFSVEKLREVVHEALRVARDVRTAESYEPRLGEEEHRDTIIGKSELMRQVYKTAGQVAASNTPVLICGENGTGKEVVARAIHGHGGRAGKPFVVVNCAAIPESLLESELFGHERGAFSATTAHRTGKFELASGGTLFLDEVGDLTLATQTRLLRVLQSGEFERLGGTETVRVDVRVIAASNRPLEPMLRNSSFRQDLYYRLNVVRIDLPPLRQRREDIPLLIEHFLRGLTPPGTGKERRISSAAIEKLSRYHWPGNVRELENTIRNAALTARGETILSTDIRLKEEAAPHVRPVELEMPAPEPTGDMQTIARKPEAPPSTARPAEGRFEDVEQLVAPIFETLVAARERGDRFSAFDVVERALLVEALDRTGGNQLRAAGLLGITRSTLRKRIARYGIRIAAAIRRAPAE